MKKRINKIILFDLGDTLFSRDRLIKDYDIDLIKNIAGIDRQTIESTISEIEKEYSGIYKHWFDNDKCNNLENEYKYTTSFFTNLFEELGIKNQLEDFLAERKNEIRYKLFPETKDYLSKLSMKYILGIVTNGRPSRREIIKQLKIEKYFDQNMIFISDEIGHSKPNKKFFNYVLHKIESDVEIILCDDENRNIDYAKGIGWKVYKIDHKNKGFKVLDVLQ